MPIAYKFGTYILKLVPDAYIYGYDGFNYEAAKLLDMDFKIQPNEILINKTIDFTLKIHTIIHEITECKHLMAMKNPKYGPAHKIAEKAENEYVNLKHMFDLAFKDKKLYNFLSDAGTADQQL